jgi:hypothetical protein
MHIALAFAVAISSTPLFAQEAKKAIKRPSMEEQLKRTRPGPEHEQLTRYAGAWAAEVRMFAGPSAIAYEGNAENRAIVGGRFLQVEYQAKGKAGDTEGVFIVSFDSRHKRYALVALDNFGTYFVTSQGKRDDATGKIKMLGTDDDPMMKALGFTKEFVHVMDLRSDDEFAVEVWIVDTRTPARKEMKYMEYVFKRKA